MQRKPLPARPPAHHNPPLDADDPRPLLRSNNGGCVSNEGTFICTDCVFDKCKAGEVRAASSLARLADRLPRRD